MASQIRAQAPAHKEDAQSFAAYMHDRPEPLDLIERTLLRLDWLVRRLRARA